LKKWTRIGPGIVIIVIRSCYYQVEELRRLTTVSLFIVVTILLALSSCIGYLQIDKGHDIVGNEFAFAQQTLQQRIDPITPQPSPLPQSKDNETAGVCHDNKTGFTVNYNRSWYASDPSNDRCVYFSPIFDIFSIDNILEPFVRISVTNASQPNMTLNQVQRIVMSYYDRNSFQPIQRNLNPDVRINVGGNNAFIVYFNWLQSQLAGLPYVDQYAAISFIPAIPPSAPAQIPEILAQLERGAAGVEVAPTPKPTAPTTNQTARTPTPTPVANETTPTTNQTTPTTNQTTPTTNQTTPTTNQTTPTTNQTTPTTNQTTPTSPKPDILGRIIAIYTIHNGKVYVIEYASPLNEFNRYLPTFIEMLRSFRFPN
jgi:hypothetical protein